MSLTRETTLFYLKEYLKFKNFGIFPQQKKYTALLDELILFIQNNTSLSAERLSRSEFELIGLPYQNNLDLNKLEKIIYEFEKSKNIDKEVIGQRQRKLRRLRANLFNVILNEESNIMYITIHRKIKIPWDQAVQILQKVEKILKLETLKEKPLPIDIRLSKTISNGTPPGLLIECQNDFYSMRIRDILDLFTIRHFTPFLKKPEKVNSQMEDEDDYICDECKRTCKREEMNFIEFGRDLCDDCFEEEQEQKYLVKTDYDLTEYEQWEGVDENNEADKRGADETWHEY